MFVIFYVCGLRYACVEEDEVDEKEKAEELEK